MPLASAALQPARDPVLALSLPQPPEEDKAAVMKVANYDSHKKLSVFVKLLLSSTETLLDSRITVR